MRLEWLPTATRDRANQLAYIAEHNLGAAVEIGDTIENAALQLLDHPRRGRPGRVRGTRELVVAGTPYIIAYRIETDVVLIIRLLHGAQRWPAEL